MVICGIEEGSLRDGIVISFHLNSFVSVHVVGTCTMYIISLIFWFDGSAHCKVERAVSDLYYHALSYRSRVSRLRESVALTVVDFHLSDYPFSLLYERLFE